MMLSHVLVLHEVRRSAEWAVRSGAGRGSLTLTGID